MKSLFGLRNSLGVLSVVTLALGSQLSPAATIAPTIPFIKDLTPITELPILPGTSLRVLDFSELGFFNTGITFELPEQGSFDVTAGFDPTLGPEPDELVQTNFLLIDGTLQFSVESQGMDDPRSYPRAGIRMAIDPDAIRIAGGRTADARLMRFDEEQGTWLRAVRAITTVGADIRFMPRREMDAVLGHYGNFESDSGSYVWAVVDTNSKYAVGVAPDLDGDGVANAADECAESPIDLIVSPDNGCTLDQSCPCEGPRGTTEAWRNHGKYVSCMAKASGELLELGLIYDYEKDLIVSEAAESACGRK